MGEHNASTAPAAIDGSSMGRLNFRGHRSGNVACTPSAGGGGRGPGAHCSEEDEMSLDTRLIRVGRRSTPAGLKAALFAPALVAAWLGSAGCDVAFSGFREEERDTSWSRSYPLSAK